MIQIDLENLHYRILVATVVTERADCCGQDEASTSGSDMDDEDMEASGMDAKIAAVLRGTADAKASVQKTKETVTQLRFRVIFHC